ncbi:MAG: glycosyltransferase [Bacteroidetes bacterium]|nr:glycosyltransferase [Bacteroidota bacterium]
MQPFRPYTIHHVQLSNMQEFVPPNGNSYTLCWWNKIPLGHVWFDGEESSLAFRKMLGEAITAPLAFYLKQHEVSDESWREYLLDGNFTAVNNLLETYSLKLPKEAIPEKLSVIICTRNRPQALAQCVEKLLNSADKDFELIVVDNAPDSQSAFEIIKKFPGVRYILEGKKGLDFARNAGLKAASNPIIAFTDDDVLVDDDWTKNIKTCFKNPLTMAVTGLVIPSELENESQYEFEKHWGFNKGYQPIIFDRHFFLKNLNIGVPVWEIGAGANMAFRREIFDIVGVFDIRLGAGASGCSDDTELWYRVLAAGWNCIYLPHIFVYHQHRTSKEELRKQLFYYMRGLACSLLVQYEKYHHKGNLFRLYNLLPDYYYKRIRKRMKGLKENFGNIFTEMRGCAMGWLYYYTHKKDQGYQFPIVLPQSLYKDVEIGSTSLVSVIIPCYNHSQYLGKAIESVLNQTYPHMEVIVVDDGSTDDPFSVCKKYEGVKYVRAERVGLPAARNIGVKHSEGHFLVFLDADDFLYPDGIQHNLDCFTANKKLVLVSGAHDRVDSAGNLLPSEKPAEKPNDNYLSLLQGNYIGMEATVMYRRNLFFAFHFDATLKAGEDYDLNLNVTRHFPAYGHTKKIAAYHIHRNNMSRDKNLMLNTTLNVLKRQEKSLRNSTERKALETGIRNWKYYYKHLKS